MIRFFNNEKGAILIITLWILAILTVLAVGIAGRMGLELKLTGYYRDSMKALYLAKAAINRAIVEKEKDDKKEEKGEAPNADILSESWANNEGLFNKKNPFIKNPANNDTPSSYYTIKYTYKESIDSEGVELYGMIDEASKININKIVTGDTVDLTRRQQLIDLLIVCGIDDAQAKADALIDWMDTNPTVYGSGDDENTRYYPDIGVDNYCKNSSLESIEELLLVEGFDSTILYGDKEQEKYGIIDYITIYTEDGLVNVNTAPKEVLQALGLNGEFESLADGIIAYRENGASPGEPENLPIVDLNKLKVELSNPIFGRDLTPEEIAKINSIIPYLTTTSKTFRTYAIGKVNKVEKRIDCVAKVELDKYPDFKYWKEN